MARITSHKLEAASWGLLFTSVLAALIVVLCLAQFPLEIAAPRLMLLTLGAVSIIWDEGDAA